MNHELDEIDHQLLKIIQSNSRISNAELARQLNLSSSATHSRVSKLEEMNIIQQYVTILNREALGFDLLCFIHITMHVHELKSLYSFQEYMLGLPEVLECHNITGQFDYVLKVAFGAVRNCKILCMRSSFLCAAFLRFPLAFCFKK